VANHLQRSLSAYRTSPTLFARERHPRTANCRPAGGLVGFEPHGSVSDTQPRACVIRCPNKSHYPTHIRRRKLHESQSICNCGFSDLVFNDSALQTILRDSIAAGLPPVSEVTPNDVHVTSICRGDRTGVFYLILAANCVNKWCCGHN
jgi:hypothetical protein